VKHCAALSGNQCADAGSERCGLVVDRSWCERLNDLGGCGDFAEDAAFYADHGQCSFVQVGISRRAGITHRDTAVPKVDAVRNVELIHTPVVTPVNRTMALLLKVYPQQRRWVRNRITPSALLAFDVVRNGRASSAKMF